MSLTDAQIKRLRASEKGQRTYFDDALPGFGVRVSQGGTKTFIALCGPKRKRHSIGRYPNMSLAEARARAKGIQAEFALESPHKVARPTLTFEDARRMFLTDSEKRNKPRTIEEYTRLLHKHFRLTGPLVDIDRHELVRILDKLKSTPTEQKHAFVAIRTMMNWCWKRGYIEASPVPPLTFRSTPQTGPTFTPPQWPAFAPPLTDQPGLAELLTGQEVTFFTGGLAEYYADGRYSYRYELGGERVMGTYEFRDDSFVCTVFENGFDRCDLVVQSGERVVMVIDDGERYPFKSIEPMPD